MTDSSLAPGALISRNGQLDVVRTLAAFMVIIDHNFFHRLFPFARYSPFGYTGVVIFFVISGYLITYGLLADRQKALALKVGMGKVYQFFFLKRALRILPLYYLIVLLAYLTHLEPVYSYIEYFLFHVGTVAIFLERDFGRSVGHLWSLNIEEQFYLIWPFVIIIAARFRRQPQVILVAIILGILFRGYLTKYVDNDIVFTKLWLLSNIDFLAMGALLAYYRFKFDKDWRLPGWAKLAVLVAFVVNLILLIFKYDWYLFNDFTLVFFGIFCLFLVSEAGYIKLPLLASIFNSRALQYLGRISYGLYLYHLPIPIWYKMFSDYCLAHHWYIPGTHAPLAFYMVSSLFMQIYFLGITILVSTLSFYFFEKPIMELRRRTALNKLFATRPLVLAVPQPANA
jgi:peptidoglycan/LPS O-acetylase OafA/YrhL